MQPSYAIYLSEGEEFKTYMIMGISSARLAKAIKRLNNGRKNIGSMGRELANPLKLRSLNKDVTTQNLVTIIILVNQQH